MPAINTIQYRRGDSATWASANPVLAYGEVGFAVDTNEIRVGDGTNAWLDLVPIGGQAAADATQALLAANAVAAEIETGRLSEANLQNTFVAVEGDPSDGDAIVWDESAEQWVPAAVEGGGTLSVLPEAEGDAGTATTARAISAARLKQQIEQHGITVIPGAVVRGVIVETGTEARPSGADVVIWVNPEELTVTNALSTDPIILSGGDSSKLDVAAAPELIRDTIGTALVAGANVTITVDDGNNTITVDAAGGGGGGGGISPLSVRPRTGMWLTTPLMGVVGNPTSTTLDRLYLAPLYIDAAASVDQVAYKIYEDASAGGHIRVGIWAAGADRRPTGAPLLAADFSTSPGAGNRGESVTPTAVAAPMFFVGYVQQVASGQMFVQHSPSSSISHVSDDKGYILNSEPSTIPDAYYVDGVSGALPDLTSATFVPSNLVPRHGVRFA